MLMRIRGIVLRIICRVIVVAIAVVAISWCSVFADQIPTGWNASNTKPIGYSDLDGRGGAFKMAIRHIGDRWYLYMGHLWNRGWSIVDVTDPTSPKYLKFIPWPQDNTWTIQMELHGNLMVTALQRAQARGWGGDAD